MAEPQDGRSCNPQNVAWTRAVHCSGIPILYILWIKNVCGSDGYTVLVCSSSQCYFHRCVPPPSHLMTLPSPRMSDHTVYFQPSDTLSSACCYGLSLLQGSWYLLFPLLRALLAAPRLTHFPGLRVSSEQPFFVLPNEIRPTPANLLSPILQSALVYFFVYLIFPYKGIRSPKGRIVTISFTGI